MDGIGGVVTVDGSAAGTPTGLLGGRRTGVASGPPTARFNEQAGGGGADAVRMVGAATGPASVLAVRDVRPAGPVARVDKRVRQAGKPVRQAADRGGSAGGASHQVRPAFGAAPGPASALAARQGGQVAFQEQFVAYLKVRNFREKTIAGYVRHLHRFAGYLRGQLNIHDLTRVTREIVLGYQQHMLSVVSGRGERLHVSTQSAYLGTLKTYYRFLTRHDHILHDPTTLLELPRRCHHLPRAVLTKAEMQRLLRQPDIGTLRGYRDRTLLELFYATGIRVSEMAGLTVHDPDIRRGTMMIRDGKGGKDRVVPLTDSAAEFTEGYIHGIRPKLLAGQAGDTLFLTAAGRPLDKYAVLDIVQRHAKRAKINKAVCCHALRHTCATHLLEGGVNIRYIQELLGHESLATTQIYTRVEIGALKRAHQKYHPRERL